MALEHPNDPPRPAKPRRVQHGLSGTPTYLIWSAMIRRCENKNQRSYRDYGARGVRVCERWRESFTAFLEDMGERPHGMSIDRINSAGNYEPGNCRWATPLQQGRNTRRNKLVDYAGQRKTVSEWAEITGLDQIMINKRLRRGWPVAQALTLPGTHCGQKTMPTDRQRDILKSLLSGPKRIEAVAVETGRKRREVEDAIARLKRDTLVERVSTGFYRTSDKGKELLSTWVSFSVATETEPLRPLRQGNFAFPE